MSITNASLVVGDSGSGKSSLLATLAEWGWEKYKKVSLLYSTDGGGFPSKTDALIRAGIIRVWKQRTRGEAFETCAKGCQGYWPVEFTDPLAGETPPGVKLVPCIKTTYSLHCKKCDTSVKDSTNRRAFQQVYSCPKCAAKVNLQVGYVTEESVIPEFFKDVGLVMIDGLTSMNDWIMEEMADKNASGEIKTSDTPMGKIISGDMTFGSNTMNHYGFAQLRASQWVLDAANIPGLIIGPVFTARKQRATDKNTKVTVYGPQIAGQAKTTDIPAWFGNCLGSSIIVDSKGRKDWRLYLTEYTEPGDPIIHLCKTRAAPGTLPDYLSDGPLDITTGRSVNDVEPFTTFNLGHFMDLMESATTKTLEETLKKHPDAPGLGYLEKLANEVEVVEPTQPVTPTPQADKVEAQPVKPKPKLVAAKPNGPKPFGRPPGRPQLKRPAPRPGQK